MRTRILTVALLALAVAAPAAAKGPTLSKADRRGIDRTLDAFVRDGVQQKNLAAAYDLVTTNIRGGVTRREWTHGQSGIYPYPAAGHTFHSWQLDYVKPTVGIELTLFGRKGSGQGAIIFYVDLKKVHGKWLVDAFNPAAVFAAPGKKASVTAHNDFAPQSGGDSGAAGGKARLSHIYVIVPFAVLGLPILGLIGYALIRRRKARQIMRTRPRELPPVTSTER